MNVISRGHHDGLTKTVWGQCADDAVAKERWVHRLHSPVSRSPTSAHSLCGDDGEGGEGNWLLRADMVRSALCSEMVASPRHLPGGCVVVTLT